MTSNRQRTTRTGDYAGRRRRKCFADTTDRVRLQDTFLILLVTILTERTNLAIATGTGVVFAHSCTRGIIRSIG